MGGCYSATSHKVLTSPRHKQPSNGSVKHKGKTPENAALLNGNGTPSKDDTDKPVQTKDSLVEDHSSPFILSPDFVPPVDSNDEKQTKGVAPSDSGIESIGPPQDEGTFEVQQVELSLCPSCHQKLQRISLGSCHQCGNVQINSGELSALEAGDTYCTCGPRVAGRQSACRTHRSKGTSDPSHRHSDMMLGLVLKSNLKKAGCGRGDGKQVRLSWKSADTDSLDMRAAMVTCMDRAKSEASEIFSDDVSFHAPLAQFDSVDCRLNGDHGGEGDTVFNESRMSIYSEILDLTDCICRCDFAASEALHVHAEAATCPTVLENSKYIDSTSQCVKTRSTSRVAASPSPSRSPPDAGLLHTETRLEKEDDDDSGHGMSKSEGRSDSDLDTGEESDRLLSAHSSPRHANFGDMEGEISWAEVAACGVCAVTVKGQRMVMMDAATYTQMLADLALLREQLSHLTRVIQEEGSVDPLNLSLTLDG